MRLEHCTFEAVEAYLGHAEGILIPIGSTEQHGPIGLIGTDWICAEAVARGVGDRLGAMVGPTITLGANQFNLGFPGTISLRATTLMALVTDYVRSLAQQGFSKFYLLNGHGGNVAPVRAAFHDLYADPHPTGLRLRLRSWWELPQVDGLRLELFGEGEGMHATPSEIAITQHLLPVHAEARRLAPPAPLPAGFARDHAGDQHPGAADHRARFPDGRVGSDSARATPEAGERLLKAAIADAATDYQGFVSDT